MLRDGEARTGCRSATLWRGAARTSHMHLKEVKLQAALLVVPKVEVQYSGKTQSQWLLSMPR
eukprot:2038141-Amphidinium_carterae.2